MVLGVIRRSQQTAMITTRDVPAPLPAQHRRLSTGASAQARLTEAGPSFVACAELDGECRS